MTKKKKKKHSRNDYLVLKNRLKNICNNEHIMQKLLSICERSNIIVRHTYMFIRCYFCYLFENKLEFPKINSQFIGNVYNCVSTVNKKYQHNDTDINDFNDKYFKKCLLKYESRDNMTQMLTYETTQIITHIENNIKEHFIKHFIKFLKIVFDYKIKLKNTRDIKTFKKMFYDIKSYILGINDKVSIEHEIFCNNIKTLLFPFPIVKNVYYDLKVEPQKFLLSMFIINSKIENINNVNETLKSSNILIKNINENISIINKKLKKTQIKKIDMVKNNIHMFNVTPLRLSLIPQNITIDSMSIIQLFGKEILSAIKSGHFRDKTIVNVETLRRNFNTPMNKYDLWSIIFNMNDKFFKHKGNYNFEYLIKTDAFSFSGTFTHKDVERCKTGRVKSMSVQNKLEVIEYVEDKVSDITKEIVCIDPNHRDIAFCGKYVENKLVTFRYTMCQRRKEMKHKKYKQYIKNFSTNIKGIESEKCLYNMKTVNFKKICDNICKVEIINRQLSNHYSDQLYRKLKFYTFLNTKKSENNMIKNFKQKMGDNKNVTVVIGDYSCNSSNLKGTIPVPSKKIINMFKRAQYDTFIMDEFRTSKICHHCNNELCYFKYRQSPKPKHKNKTELIPVHGLLRHPTEVPECQIICNRDKNAVSNMLKILKHIVKNKEKPLIFQSCYS
jgi:hypothetical protein